MLFQFEAIRPCLTVTSTCVKKQKTKKPKTTHLGCWLLLNSYMFHCNSCISLTKYALELHQKNSLFLLPPSSAFHRNQFVRSRVKQKRDFKPY